MLEIFFVQRFIELRLRLNTHFNTVVCDDLSTILTNYIPSKKLLNCRHYIEDSNYLMN